MFEAGPFSGKALCRQCLFQAGPFSRTTFGRQGLLQARHCAGKVLHRSIPACFNILVHTWHSVKSVCSQQLAYSGSKIHCPKDRKMTMLLTKSDNIARTLESRTVEKQWLADKPGMTEQQLLKFIKDRKIGKDHEGWLRFRPEGWSKCRNKRGCCRSCRRHSYGRIDIN